MGIRINKVIGYGFDDLTIKQDQYDLSLDKRFNPEGYFCTSYEDREEKWSLEELQIQLQIMSNDRNDTNWINYLLLGGSIKDQKFDFDNLFIFDPEFGIPSVCLFIPPGNYDSWREYDRMVDYYEECAKEEGSISRVVHVDRALYPYESWVDLRTDPPTRLDDKQWGWFSLAKWNSDHLNEQDRQNLQLTAAKELNFDSYEDMNKLITPIIPPELVVVLRYLKVFNNPKDIHTLKPMIYTYWS